MTRRRLISFAMVLWLTACATPVVMPPGPAVAAPRIDGDTLIAADGARLPLRSWLPEDGQPRAVIIALHGFNDYSAFIADAAGKLAASGIATYAYDQRGFGGAPNRGYWSGVPAMTGDAKAAVAAVRARHPNTPLYLFGESMGGAVVLVTMAAPDAPAVDGVILSAPAVWGRASMPWYQTVALWVAAHTLPGSQRTGAGLGVVPSDNREMLKALGRDPMVIKETRIDAIWGLVNLMDAAMAAAPKQNAPVLLLYGEKDQLIPPGAIAELLARMPPAGDHRRVAYYADGYHMLLRDLHGPVVVGDVKAWITDRADPLPSGADAFAAGSTLCATVTACAMPPSGRRTPL